MSNKPSAKIDVGAKIRVKPGTKLPEFPDVLCAGWSGIIREVVGKKRGLKYTVEWDASTIEQMPADYLQKCEQLSFLHEMACLPADQVEVCE